MYAKDCQDGYAVQVHLLVLEDQMSAAVLQVRDCPSLNPKRGTEHTVDERTITNIFYWPGSDCISALQTSQKVCYFETSSLNSTH